MQSKKVLIIGVVIVIILIIAGIITNYIDSSRVKTNHEPKYCIKTINNDGSKVTYWGLGYKVIRYVGISPNEPYESNIGTKMGNWFMKYELTQKDNIDIKSAENFEIVFYDKHPENSYKKYTILDKSETDKYNYNIYGYDGQVNIRIEGKDYSLKEALINNKITMEKIIAKANQDMNDKKITGDMYKDGGSMIYQYENYTIIKCHTIDGNRDVYIGTKEMNINDVI